MEPKDIMSAVLSSTALIVSVLTFALNYRHSRRVAVLSRKPVLVFVWDDRRGWVLSNVGSGPALNVIVAQRRADKWFKPVRVPPIAKDAEFIPLWLGDVNTTSLGTTYTDTEGKAYTSITSNDLTKTFEGSKIGPWLESVIQKHWNVSKE